MGSALPIIAGLIALVPAALAIVLKARRAVRGSRFCGEDDEKILIADGLFMLAGAFSLYFIALLLMSMPMTPYYLASLPIVLAYMLTPLSVAVMVWVNGLDECSVRKRQRGGRHVQEEAGG